ncbi:MAG: PAS domain S-box protein [Vicinamibacteria bacterium]
MRILYVEDSPADADLTRIELAGYDPAASLETAPTLAEARKRLAADGPYDLVLIDLRLPDGSGMDLLHEIRRSGLGVAVVILTSVGDEEVAVAALKAGADDYVAKREGYAARLPTTLEAALARFRAERQRRSGTLRVLYAEHHASDLALTERHLAQHAPHIRVEVVDSGEEALRRLPATPGQACPCDVLMLDYRLPGDTALDVLKVIREDRRLDVPVVLVTGQGDEEVAAQALRLGATDYLVKNPNYLYALPAALENAHHRVLLAREQMALRESEARLAGVIDSAMDAIVSIGADQRIVLFNPAAERMFRCSREEAVGRPLDRFLPERFRASHREAVDSFGGTGITNRAMVGFRTVSGLRADGEEFPTEAAISRTQAGGKPLFTVVLRDVTERARSLEQLKESEARFRQITDCIDEVFWMTDPTKQQMLYVSPGYERIWGRTCESLYASPKDWLDAVHPDDRARVAEAAVTRQAAGTFDERYRIVRPDGGVRWIRDRAFPVADESGRVHRIVGVAEDVTAQDAAQQALRHQEEKFSRAFQASPDGIVISSLSDGRLVEVNDVFVRLSGFSREQALGRTTLELGVWVDPGERETYLARIREAGTVREQPAAFRDASGGVRECLVSGEIMRLGQEAFALTTIRDVTELKRSEAERRALEAQLRQAQKMEAIGRLAGGVAHDFNNMLGVILGYADIALRKVPTVDPVHKSLRAIRDAAERSADLTRQLLAFSRRQTIAPRVLDLNAQLKGMERLLHRIIGEDVELRFVLAAEPWPVLMDPSQVDQILANLAVNARDAMPDGGTLTVETAAVSLDAEYCETHPGSRPGEYVLLTVTDTGIGMDESTRERAFEPFFTTKPEGKGTGLGLAMVYGVVKQNEGFVEIESEIGRGTTFRIHIPRTRLERRATEPAATAGPPARGRETVLLVEDQQQLREITRELLESLGYAVLEAPSPGDALTLCEKHGGEIHLLLTDVVMPVMNGKELAERVKAIRPRIRTLFTSGYTADTIGRRGVLEPGVWFIEKPFSLDSLARKLREVLGAP